jgi:AcrR family transcriptional regulator
MSSVLSQPSTANLPSAPAGGRPLRRDAAENRRRILAAASVVFADHGLDAGVEEVARVAGVGMGTLYRRFPSKQALIDELISAMRRELLDIAQRAAARTDGTGLEQLLVNTGRLQADHLGCLRRLWAQSEAGMKAIEDFRRLVPVLLQSAQQHGRIRPEITHSDISMVLWSVSAIIDTSATVAPQAWQRHLELLIAGLRPVTATHLAVDLHERPMTSTQARAVTARR